MVSFELERPRSAALGDLDGDGDLDVAVATAATYRSMGIVSVRFNDGNGNFADEAVYEAGYGPAVILIEDLDGDNDLDLAVTDETVGEVMIWTCFNADS